MVSSLRRAWDWFCENVLDPEPTDFASYDEELR